METPISLLSAHTVMEYRPTVLVKGFVASNVILVFVVVETACSYDYTDEVWWLSGKLSAVIKP